MTNAIPVARGRLSKKRTSGSSPPADAPMPTTNFRPATGTSPGCGGVLSGISSGPGTRSCDIATLHSNPTWQRLSKSCAQMRSCGGSRNWLTTESHAPESVMTGHTGPGGNPEEASCRSASVTSVAHSMAAQRSPNGQLASRGFSVDRSRRPADWRRTEVRIDGQDRAGRAQDGLGRRSAPLGQGARRWLLSLDSNQEPSG
jgi:hypothetical protein